MSELRDPSSVARACRTPRLQVPDQYLCCEIQNRWPKTVGPQTVGPSAMIGLRDPKPVTQDFRHPDCRPQLTDDILLAFETERSLTCAFLLEGAALPVGT